MKDGDWRSHLPDIKRASESLRKEAEAHTHPALKSKAKRLSEELLDILTQLKQLKERSGSPPNPPPGGSGFFQQLWKRLGLG
jgi:hypothetical protein